jgi:EAL domain-containing protein (putative c-di-GMP-specific phosphodiesterase class I)
MTTPEDQSKNPPQDSGAIPPERPQDVNTLPPGSAPGIHAATPTVQDAGTDAPWLAGGQAQYLHPLTEQLTGWDNPRAMLEHALRENHFLLLAQKILPLKPGSTDPLCYEVLLRLKQEEDSLLPPGGFFDIAESLGLMAKIDRWVVRSVLAWCAAWQKASPEKPLPVMCINLSAPALKSVSFLGAVREEIRHAGVSPRALCFEINERDIIEQATGMQRFNAELKQLGCRFSVEGFGSVRSSFAHLKGLAIDFVKIEGAITERIVHNPLEFARLQIITEACQKLGMRSVATFVETQPILDKLLESGVDYVQGFGIARPEPIGKLS